MVKKRGLRSSLFACIETRKSDAVFRGGDRLGYFLDRPHKIRFFLWISGAEAHHLTCHLTARLDRVGPHCFRPPIIAGDLGAHSPLSLAVIK